MAKFKLGDCVQIKEGGDPNPWGLTKGVVDAISGDDVRVNFGGGRNWWYCHKDVWPKLSPFQASVYSWIEENYIND